MLNENISNFQKAHDHGESVNSLWTATAIARLKTAMEEVVKLFATRWQPPLEMPTPFGVVIEPGWFGSRVNKRYNVVTTTMTERTSPAR